MQPGEYHDIALPRPSYEGLYGTIYCSRCEFFGLGYNHPEWCTWEWLKETGAAQHSLDLIELGERAASVSVVDRRRVTATGAASRFLHWRTTRAMSRRSTTSSTTSATLNETR